MAEDMTAFETTGNAITGVPDSARRICGRCGKPLSRHNKDNYCGPYAVTDDRPAGACGHILPPTDLGARLRAVRERRGMTLETLGGLCGVSGAYICMIETGKRSLDRYSMILSLANALRVPPSEFADGFQIMPAAPAPRDSIASHSKRGRLVARRKAVCYSQEGLAERLRVDRSTIGRWESGETAPQPWIRPKLAKVLQLSLDQLNDLLRQAGPVSAVAENDAPPSTWPDADASPRDDKVTSEVPGAAQEAFTGIDDMNRRELLRIMTMVGALTAAASISDEIDWERVGFAGQTGKIDSCAIDDLAALNDHLWRVFVLSRTKQTVFPLVRDHLDTLVNTLPNAGSTGAYRRLCGCASSAFQLCGEILFDGNRYTEAAHCYVLAATAGREAGINDLWACALTRHAFIGLYERRFDKATHLLDLADGLARNGNQALATRHWIAAVQAQAFAGLGRLSECQRAIEAADQVHELSGNYHNGGWLRFDGSRLAEERGACYVQLKRFDLAESALADALSRHLSPRRRGGVLVDLAILGSQQDDLDRTLSYADAATRIINQTGSGYVVRKLIGLQPYLRPFMDDMRARNLNDQIGAFAVSATVG
jgi:transcriptional regulator with XRE-family HTH domain